MFDPDKFEMNFCPTSPTQKCVEICSIFIMFKNQNTYGDRIPGDILRTHFFLNCCNWFKYTLSITSLRIMKICSLNEVYKLKKQACYQKKKNKIKHTFLFILIIVSAMTLYSPTDTGCILVSFPSSTPQGSFR